MGKKKKEREEEEDSCVLFECSICYSEQSIETKKQKPNRIQCPDCQKEVCIECQDQYGKGHCMHCKMVWKRSFLDQMMGKTFYEKRIKPEKTRELLEIEKEKLPRMQHLVEWEKKVREQKANIRFGILPNYPSRPELNKIQKKQVFPCPLHQCRGFIENGICGVCHLEVCSNCHQKKGEDHICKMEDIQSIISIYQETKQCPRCTTFIYRTEGCNHMYCTNCHSHFDWKSGKILSTSTNGHYLNVKKFANEAILYEKEKEKEKEEEERESTTTTTQMKPEIEIERIGEALLTTQLRQALYEDANCIRVWKWRKYNEKERENDYMQKMEEYAIRYLMNELDERKWSQNIYQMYIQKERGFLIGEVLDLYLKTVAQYQQRILDAKDHIEIKQEWMEFITSLELEWNDFIVMCNESLESIAMEYGGNKIRIRNIYDSTEYPSFTLE